ncbi:hypothetical protein [Maribacter ulvicola]|uniref:Uncharacterized protein n=1 Tax=Maribacter ulvicola TaxID=228959 RepID=A0A1N6PT21_9FLAO|nr:hypothetical protein [Maribacter ulvicola]SIQ07359.1 hypothetical protein SAMN05421797_101580 [Maribacter ulvicola]
MRSIEVNWKKNLPKESEISKMWRDINYKIVDPNFEFIDLLKEHIGGHIYFKGFQFDENEVFDWFCSRGRLDEINFVEQFLLSDSVIQSFTTVEDGDYLFASKTDKTPKLEWKSEFAIDGELSALLFHGGAYGSSYKRTPKEVKKKAQEFCEQIFGEKYQNEFVRFYYISGAWNTWFIDFIIDHSWIIISMESRTIWMLCFTDTD